MVCYWISDSFGIRGIFCIYQVGTWVATGVFGFGTASAILLIAGFAYLLIRPYKAGNTLKPSWKSIDKRMPAK